MKPIDQTSIQEVLREKFDEIRVRRPSYSQRAYAEKLGLSSGSLTLILAGKRRISEKKARAISQALKLSSADERKLLKPFRIKSSLKQKKTYQSYSLDICPPERVWIIFGILNLVKLSEIQLSAQLVSQVFPVSLAEADQILELLFRNRLLVLDEDGKARRTAERLTTLDNQPSDALKTIQRSHVQEALKSQLVDPVELRDLTAMTMPIATKDLPTYKRLIREFQDAIEEISDPAEYDAVYTLNVQLFPIVRHTDVIRHRHET